MNDTPPLSRIRHVAAPILLGLAGLAAGAQTLHAQAASPTTSADIRDIRGPKPLSSPWLISVIASACLLAAGSGAAVWRWKRRRFGEQRKTPLDIALDRLEKAQELMVPGRVREFSIEVSGVVRGFIESRFGVRAAQLTTHEFLHGLLQHADSPLAAYRLLLDNFLETCDLGKFGGWNLAAPDMETMLQSARQFVIESAASSEPAPADAAPATPLERYLTPVSRDIHASLSST